MTSLAVLGIVDPATDDADSGGLGPLGLSLATAIGVVGLSLWSLLGFFGPGNGLGLRRRA